jgi:hypothetical protein
MKKINEFSYYLGGMPQKPFEQLAKLILDGETALRAVLNSETSAVSVEIYSTMTGGWRQVDNREYAQLLFIQHGYQTRNFIGKFKPELYLKEEKINE